MVVPTGPPRAAGLVDEPRAEPRAATAVFFNFQPTRSPPPPPERPRKVWNGRSCARSLARFLSKVLTRVARRLCQARSASIGKRPGEAYTRQSSRHTAIPAKLNVPCGTRINTCAAAQLQRRRHGEDCVRLRVPQGMLRRHPRRAPEPSAASSARWTIETSSTRGELDTLLCDRAYWWCRRHAAARSRSCARRSRTPGACRGARRSPTRSHSRPPDRHGPGVALPLSRRCGAERSTRGTEGVEAAAQLARPRAGAMTARSRTAGTRRPHRPNAQVIEEK